MVMDYYEWQTTCQPLYGRKTGEPGFNPACDLNNDGVINLKDIWLTTRWRKAATIEYTFFRILADDNQLKTIFLNGTQEALEQLGYGDTDRAQNPRISFVGHPGIWKVSVDVYEGKEGQFPPLVLIAAAVGGILLGIGVTLLIMIEFVIKPIEEAAQTVAENLETVMEKLEEADLVLDEALEEGLIDAVVYGDLKAILGDAYVAADAAAAANKSILEITRGFPGFDLDGFGSILLIVLVIVAIGAIKK